MSLSTYHSGNSALHRLPPGIKLLLLIGGSSALFWVTDWRVITYSFVAVLLLYLLARIPFKMMLRQIRPALLLCLLIAAVQYYLNGWQMAVLVALRLLTLLLMASLVTLTTQVSAMIDSITRGLGWLRFLGINPAKVGLAISLVLRFIPVIVTISAEVREAQQARGLERNLLALIIPVIIRTLRNADDIADAIECRSFD